MDATTMLLKGIGGDFVNKGTMPRMITDEQKRQFAELSMDLLESRERDGDDRKLVPLIDQWEALEEKIRRVVCYDEILSWFTEFHFEQPVTLH